MAERSRHLIKVWLDGLDPERRANLYLLLDELCGGMDVSRHNRFGFLRLRAEFETSGELFGCTLDELRDAVAATFDGKPPKAERPPSALEELRSKVSKRGHPDFR